MSTRSLIGRLNADGTVTYVYCHYDGYLDGVGAKLHDFYQDASKVDELIGLGSLSSIGEHIGEKHDFNWMENIWNEHGYDPRTYSTEVKAKYDRLNSMTLAYHRDRGEKFADEIVKDEAAFWVADQWTEYWYLFKDGSWWVKCYDAEPLLLTAAIELEEANAEGNDLEAAE